jgi:hypothetical protein
MSMSTCHVDKIKWNRRLEIYGDQGIDALYEVIGQLNNLVLKNSSLEIKTELSWKSSLPVSVFYYVTEKAFARSSGI